MQLSDKSNKKKQPDTPKENGETYSLYVFAGKLSDTQFEELVKVLDQRVRRANKRDSEN
jgi:hypothetical protein